MVLVQSKSCLTFFSLDSSLKLKPDIILFTAIFVIGLTEPWKLQSALEFLAMKTLSYEREAR